MVRGEDCARQASTAFLPISNEACDLVECTGIDHQWELGIDTKTSEFHAVLTPVSIATRTDEARLNPSTDCDDTGNMRQHQVFYPARGVQTHHPHTGLRSGERSKKPGPGIGIRARDYSDNASAILIVAGARSTKVGACLFLSERKSVRCHERILSRPAPTSAEGTSNPHHDDADHHDDNANDGPAHLTTRARLVENQNSAESLNNNAHLRQREGNCDAKK